ncbi:1-deoxy-D-xylulose-5-phosphate synthase [Sulfoacidibacillus thermotolerans]|uniref:1-deoxy-D-xylulose-5-phosphate synthase n=2 Tax=Sulfoacidibacillus thermotolerans TaxID=1765684 RepID=A0A2U3DCL1_SULT2|nr:1-deoxy-D-xylulose-5-phosphate synthase [Sulfoacidibacillus thermotolerans]
MLTVPELETLSKEIRDFLVQSITSTGGHFGANLGVVELSVALHYVFNSPVDRIVWDVGHQAYVHKILTGRKEQFPTLRQFHGLAGFPKRSESPHDAFGVGHASTSISAALGMAIARDLRGESHHVVAVIGDGAMTGGMAFEALNHAGHLKKRLLVILNDNEMSISPNVGAVSHYLTRLRADPYYGKLKTEFESLLKRIPAFGSRLANTAERLKDTLKYAMVPGILFEELGFSYFGPVPGHDVGQVIQLLSQAKEMEGPVLLHVVTQKGKGYASAEAAPDKLHSIGGAVVKPKSSAPSYTSVFGKTLVDLAKKDERIVAVTAAMLNSGLNEFVTEFPDRCFDVGIAEQHAATLCAGLATTGMRPIFSVYSTFLQRAYDQVIHDICIQKLPVVFAIDRAGLVGPDGETHQGAFDAAFLRAVPNLTIMMPKDEGELRHMLYTAFTLSGPVAVRFPREDGVGVPLDVPYETIPIGKAETLREGKDVALLALGPMVAIAENAALMLQDRGISAHVVNMRFVKPIDEDALRELALRNMPMITIEEGTVKGGLGSAVLEYFALQKLSCTVYPLGLPDRFIEHGSRPELLHQVGLTSEHIAQIAISLVEQQQGQKWANRKTAGR